MTKKNWNHLGKRTLAIFLTLIMCLGMLPVSVFAEEASDRKCPVCKLGFGEVGKWKDVDLVYVEEVPSTCQEHGIKAHYTCPECGTNFHRNTVGPPNRYSGPVDRLELKSCDYSVPATCTSKATCKWCGAEDPDGQIDPNNHAEGCTLSTWLETEDHQGHYKEYSECKAKVDEGTHTRAGAWGKDANQHWHVCSVCDAILDTKADHTWDGGTVTAEPTATEKGIKTFACTECGQTKTEDIDPTGEGGGETSVPVENVTVLPNPATVTVGKTVALTATVTPEDATDKTVTWTSGDETVATVDGNGVVTAVAKGNVTITAAAGGQSATCAVTVTAAVPTPPEEVVSVTVNPKDTEIKVGETVTLTATVTSTDKTVTWYSNDESVATVVNGTVTGIKAGTATITAVVGEGLEAKSDTCVVTVTATAPKGCQHETTKAIDNGDETHRIVCAVEGCDYVFTEEEYAHEPHKWFGDACAKCGVQAVARIDDQYFTTIQAAVDKAKSGNTIEMIADSDKPATIPAGKEITLNLNGKTLTNKETNASSWSASTLRNYGTLTIAGEGTIRADAQKGSSMTLYNYEGGTTILKGGTYINDNGDYTVWNQGTMTIENATMIKEKAGSPSILINGWRNGGSEHPNGPSCSLTINNCTIEGKVDNSIAIKNDDWGELVINNGSFSAGICLQNANIAEIHGGRFTNPVQGAARLIYHNPFNSTYGKGELTITGGDFYSADNSTAVIQRVSQNNVEGKLEISGGTYFKEDAVVNQYATEGRKLVPIEGQKDRWQLGVDVTNAVAKIVRTGEEYTTLQAAVVAAQNGDTVELLKSTTGASLTTAKSITVNIPEGMTVSPVTGKTYVLAVANEGAVLTITGAGTIQGETYGVLAQKGATQLTIDMNGGRIEGGKYGVYAGSGTIVEVSNGNINAVSATETSFGLYANGSTVAVSGGTISGTTYGLAAVNQAKVTVSGNAVIQSTPTDEMKADPKKYVSTAGIIIQNGPELILNGGTVTGGYTGISVSGYRDGTTKPATRLLMNGGIVTGEGFGIGGNGTWDYTDITIADGSVISENSTAIYHPQVGDLTISGGNISGVNGVQYSGAGDLTISGGRIMASLDYTEFPQKPSSQTDGTIADGAALSILSRGSGYQDGDQRMNVTITGGEFISVGNSAVAVYRVKQQADKTWVTGDVTGLSSYLASLDITGGTFTGNDDKGVLDIESIAMSAKSITGGYYSQDIDAGEVNYVDDGYASHPVSTPSGYFHVHQPAFSGSYSYDAANHWTGCTGHRDCLEGSVFEPHIWDNGVITVEPQVGVPGIRTFHCTVCEATRTETLPALMEDNIGGGADGRSPDGIPDIQEAVVYYTTSNEAYGTVAGAYQTFNLGSANASGTVTLGNTASTTTLSRTYFSSWTQSGTVLSTGTDLNVEFAVTAGSTYQVIANFGRTGTGGGGGGGTGGGGTTGGGGGGTTIVDEEVPLAGDTQLNRDDHFAYVSGYADGTVRPTNNITREEVAAIFYRLLTEESRAIYDTDVNDFSDVAGDRWSNRAISTLTNAGILSGYPDGTFRPGQTITRAEFAAIAAQFDVVTEGVENPFSDTTGHWAENLISFAAGKGWVSGYTDGTFLPQKAITRAEAMTLINNVLNRRVDEEGLLDEAKQWSDNPEGTWYYYEVLEATNSHDYDRRTEGELVENWTAVTNG